MIYFHIGTVKTGTSHIQKTLHMNREVFARHDLLYPCIVDPQLHLPRYANAGFLDD